VYGPSVASTITGDTSGSGEEDGAPITGTLSATDPQGLTDSTIYSIESGDEPSNGSATIDPASGAWSYTPTANFYGTDAFTVTVTDDLGGTTPQQIDLTVTDTPEPAVAEPEPTPEPQPTPEPAPTPSPEPTPDPTPADTAPLATDVQLSDDDGDGLKEVITAADGELIDGNGDGIADAEQADVVGLRMINDGADNTDYGALETDPALSFSAISFLRPTETATDATGTGNNAESYAVTTRDGQTQTTAIPTGIDNAFAGLLAFTVSGLSNGGSTSTTISLPQGLNNLDTAQLAYLRFNYASNRFEDFVDSSGSPLYSFQDSNGDGQPDSVVLQLIDGDPAWDGDGIANGSIIDPGFLATGDRTVAGNNKANTLQGNVLANTLLGKNGSDTLIGGLGNDTLLGHGKHDRLRGGEGNDNLKGKTGDDRLNGGDHDDRLNGGKGDDTLIGGSGADRFRLSGGDDTIKDFSIADDDQLLIGNTIELTIEQVGRNLLLTDADKAISTTLKNVALDDLLSYQPELLG
ncbi:MAG: Ig-like domain-containing protein, partial [Synechococcus sp.]